MVTLILSSEAFKFVEGRKTIHTLDMKRTIYEGADIRLTYELTYEHGLREVMARLPS
jgi:hypothetical protein